MKRRVAGATEAKARLARLDTTAADASVALPDASSSNWLSMRTIALTMLVLQNATVSLLTRLSRTTMPPGQRVYIPAVAVFSAELLKLAVSMTMLVRERRIAAGAKGRKRRNVIQTAQAAIWDLAVNQRPEIIKLAVPAALYAIQNTLLYTALSNLDAATYQTTYQLKLLTTALFSLMFFKKALSLKKWFSLLLLTAGVATVQLESVIPSSSSSSSPSSAFSPSSDELGGQDPKVGLVAIFAACISSGLAGAWFEWVLKAPSPPTPTSQKSCASESTVTPLTPVRTSTSSSPPTPTSPAPRLRAGSPSLWARNIQLSVPSLVFSLSGVLMSPELEGFSHRNIWSGFTPLVWTVVINQALGGLLVAMVVRYADSVAKGFATSLAIVLSTLASVLIFGLLPGPLFVMGASMVILSTCIYAADQG